MKKIINSLIKSFLFTLFALNTTNLSCLQNTRQHKSRRHSSRNTRNKTRNTTRTRKKRHSVKQVSNSNNTRRKSSFVGCKNDRGICYANAVLQCLFQSRRFISCIKSLSKSNKFCKEAFRQYNYLKKGKPARLNKLVDLVEPRGQSQMVSSFLTSFLKKTGIKLGRLGITTKYFPDENIRLSEQNNGQKILGVIIHPINHFYSYVCHNRQWYECNDFRTRKIANPMNKVRNTYYLMFCEN